MPLKGQGLRKICDINQYILFLITFCHFIKGEICQFCFDLEKSNYYTWFIPVTRFYLKIIAQCKRCFFAPSCLVHAKHCNMHRRARALCVLSV